MRNRAVLYARVCVDDGDKLDEQLQACRAHAANQGWQIVAELMEIGPATEGTGSDLPQWKHAVEMAEAGAFDILVMRDLTRLSRSLPILLTVKDTLSQCHVQIECVVGYPMRAGVGILVGEPPTQGQAPKRQSGGY